LASLTSDQRNSAMLGHTRARLVLEDRLLLPKPPTLFGDVNFVRLTFGTLESMANWPWIPCRLIQYFCQQWLVNVKPIMWNTHKEDLRTNNDYEGWHARFNNAIRHHHTNILPLPELHAREAGVSGVAASADCSRTRRLNKMK